MTLASANTVEHFLDAVVAAGLFPNATNLRFHLDSLFEGVPLEGRGILDVGGGAGVHSL